MKIGTIGTGLIVEQFIKAINVNEGVHLEAVYSRNEDTAKAFAKKNNANKYYSNLEDLLNDDEIDTIYIASPNILHFPQALQALNANKNVIGEKPFTSTLEETDILISLAKEKKLFLFEAITNIHLPNFKIIKDSLQNIGNVKLLTANFSQYSSRYDAYKEQKKSNAFDPAFSGGALMDINVYNIHFTVGLFGKPNSYKYYPNIGYNGIDTSGVMIFEYDDFIATLIGTKDSSSDTLCFIQGDEGFIKISESATSACKRVTEVSLEKNQDIHRRTLGEGKDIGINQEMQMVYEVQVFEEITKNKDYEACYKLLDHTRDVMEIIYNSRIAANILFDADKK